MSNPSFSLGFSGEKNPICLDFASTISYNSCMVREYKETARVTGITGSLNLYAISSLLVTVLDRAGR